jgi:oligopeptide transport system substrate-binding protein
VDDSDDWATPDRILSSGPYLLTDLQPGVGATLVKNPLYHDAGSVSIAQAVIHFIPDPANALSAYVENRLDTAPVPLALIKRMQDDPLFKDQLRQKSELCTDYLGFTTVKAPVNNAQVRLALSQAINRAALVGTIYGGAATPAHHLSPPGAFAAPEASRTGVQSDANGARDRLARAGYPGGAGFPAITLMVADGQRNRELAAAIQEMWKSTLGIETQVQVEPAATFFEILNSTTPLPQVPHAWLLSRCAEFPDAHRFLAPTFHVELSPNYARRVATAFEENLDRAAKTRDPADRRALYVAAEQNLAAAEAAYAPLVHHVSYLVVKPWLTRDVQPFGGLHIRDWTINMTEKLEARAASSP